MAIVTDFVDGKAEVVRLGNEVIVVENELDFSVTTGPAADTIQALKIPAKAFVTDVWLEVVTAEGSAGNTDVGDGDTVDGWDVDVNINSAAIVKGDGAFVGGKYYATADTIDLTPSIELDTAVIRIFAKYHIVEV